MIIPPFLLSRYLSAVAIMIKPGQHPWNLFSMRSLVYVILIRMYLLLTHSISLTALSRYHTNIIRAMAVLAYTGWMILTAKFALSPALTTSTPLKKTSSAFFALISASLWAILAVQRSPRPLYIYSFFPLYFWWQIFANGGGDIFLSILRILEAPRSAIRIFLHSILCIAALWAMVVSGIFWFIRQHYNLTFSLSMVMEQDTDGYGA